MQKDNAKVIIAGAGPVGAVAAYRLAQAGIDVILFESFPNCPEDLRASTLHPPTLEMMAELGIIDKLEELGVRAPIYQYRNRQSGECYEFDLSELKDVTKYPYRLQCEQYKLARHLTDLLKDHPHAEVKFSHKVIGYEQDAKGVTVIVESPFSIERYKAEYLVGCDGANSMVRKWMGVEFEGFTYPEKFVTFSTETQLENYFEGLSLVNYVADPNEWMVLLKVPSLWRVLVPAHNLDDAFIVSDTKKQEVFQNLLADPTVKTKHRTIYKVHQRVAKNYIDNRVILAGDAAHLNNPLGGFGMNSGVHDVWNLSDKLIRILNEKENPQELLSTYETQRRAVMQSFVQTQTIQNKKDLEEKGAAAQRKYQDKLEGILGNDEKRREYLLGQSMFNSLKIEKQFA